MAIHPSDDLVIKVPKEFSFKENINYMSRSSNECMFEIRDDKVVKAIPVGDEVPLVEISEGVGRKSYGSLFRKNPSHKQKST